MRRCFCPQPGAAGRKRQSRVAVGDQPEGVCVCQAEGSSGHSSAVKASRDSEGDGRLPSSRETVFRLRAMDHAAAGALTAVGGFEGTRQALRTAVCADAAVGSPCGPCASTFLSEAERAAYWCLLELALDLACPQL